ncbi:MAG: hypothetical protein IJ150_10325 [Bacteroidales bacterium]|nr:hypothetical protein [Bacteroidales bacterium]
MIKNTKLAAILMFAATATFGYVSCDDDDDNKKTEENTTTTSEATDFQKSISGTFVELFTEKGFFAT